MKRAVVVIGAGASKDVHNGTTPVQDQNLKPPIARELFEYRFWRFRGHYPGAEVIGAELGRMAMNKRTTFDLEARLTAYAESSDARERRAFKDIPPYFRDIFVQVSDGGYVPSPTNYINLVRRLLRDETHEIIFVVLNYDTLLERALKQYDPRMTMNSLKDYVAPSRQAHVVKIHGSIDWAVPIPGTSKGDVPQLSWVPAVDGFDPSSASSDDIVMAAGGRASNDWHSPGPGRALLYPWLTAPLRGKAFSCPDDHTNHLRNFVSDCRKFMIIGSSGLDEDLLDLFGENISGAHVVYHVNEGEGSEKAWDNFETKVPAFSPIGRTMPIVAQFAGGLTSFLDEDGIEKFLASD